jgi:hypothetical protein
MKRNHVSANNEVGERKTEKNTHALLTVIKAEAKSNAQTAGKKYKRNNNETQLEFMTQHLLSLPQGKKSRRLV